MSTTAFAPAAKAAKAHDDMGFASSAKGAAKVATKSTVEINGSKYQVGGGLDSTSASDALNTAAKTGTINGHTVGTVQGQHEMSLLRNQINGMSKADAATIANSKYPLDGTPRVSTGAGTSRSNPNGK